MTLNNPVVLQERLLGKNLLISYITFAAAFTASATGKLEIQGHRGARWSRPENTLPAFQFAIEAGVDTIELDTLVTQDNQVVVVHDPTINPEICLGPKGVKIKSKIPIRSLTLKELKQYDCGALVNPRFKYQVPVPGTGIPTLDEVFALVEKLKKPVFLNIETKSDEKFPEYSPAPEEFVDLILKVVRKHKAVKRVTLQSFDYRTLKAARRKEPGLSLSVLIEDRPKKPLADLAGEIKAQIVSPNFEWLTADDVRLLHAKNIRVIPWTVNDPADWKRLKEMGVDGLISDNPEALLNYLKQP